MNGRRGMLLGVFLLAACHDAPRRNPLDPELTPAVTLTRVEPDQALGRVLLEWTPYAGGQPFAEYQIRRKVQGLEQVDTVAYLPSQQQTSFLDTSLRAFGADRIYLYRVAVVNRSGYTVESAEVAAGAFVLQAADLASARPDSVAGTVALSWDAYRGPGFERYEIWRRNSGEERLLDSLADAAQTAWTDTTPLPEREYAYWVITRAAGTGLSSQRQEVSYRLPAPELSDLEMSSVTATAVLRWSPYRGPRFSAYEIRRSTAEDPERTVTSLTDGTASSYTDTALEGNTEYSYRLTVRTTWGEAITVASRPRQGAFYRLQQPVWELPAQSTSTQTQAVGLAVDQADGVSVLQTRIGTTTAHVMNRGIFVLVPGAGGFRTVFADRIPEPLSSIHAFASGDRLYVTVGLEGGGALVGALETTDTGVRQVWVDSAATGGALPVGLFLEPASSQRPAGSDDVVLVDDQGWMHAYSTEGERREASDRLRRVLVNADGLPLGHVVGAPGAGEGADPFGVLLLAPNRAGHHLLGRIYLRQSGGLYVGMNELDDGVGLGHGLTLVPQVVAFDRSRCRLVLLERSGLLQLLDGRDWSVANKQRYITQWGRFGDGDGEFMTTPLTCAALAVDSRGRIYVADGRDRIQVFAP